MPVSPDALPKILPNLKPLGTALLAALLWMPSLHCVAAQPGSDAQPSADPDALSRSLEPLMAGEFALQSGRLDEASRLYLQAAREADDAEVARRATQLAVLAKDEQSAEQALKLWRAQGGSGPVFQAVEATLALRRGDDRLAGRLLTTMLQAPGDEGWRHVLGVIGGGARDPDQATRVLRGLVDKGAIPDKLQAWLAFGGLAQNLGQPDLAEEIVAEVVRRFPGEPRVALLRASQLRQASDKEQARAVLAALADQVVGDTALRLAVAAEYDALDDLPAAAAVLARGPQDDQTYALRASLLARSEDKAALQALYEELRLDAAKPDPSRRLLLGQMAEFLERHEEALEWYRDVPGGPQMWQARLRSASVLHELDRKDEAYQTVRELQAEAAAPDGARRNAYLLEAELRREDGDAGGEMDVFENGLGAFPDDPEILYARALSWERRDDIARAEADFRRILVVQPDSVAALNALGYTLADRTTRYQEALELINRARAASPDNAAIIDSYGWVLYRLGRTKEALGELRRAFALQKDPEIAAHLGEVLWESGKRDEARKVFEEARELDPESRALERALKRTGA